MTDQRQLRAERNDDLIDRYVAAVGRRLPAKQAADIAAELREAVQAQLEEKEAALGRPLERAELVAILKSFGSPMLAASRYAGQDYLIGPNLYPYFWPTARIVVGIVAAVAIVGFLVQGVLSDNPLHQVLQGIGAAWSGALWSFGIVTVIFIVLEQTKAGVKIEASWRPEQLPRDTQNKPKSLFESLFSLAWDAIFIAWWVGLLHFPNGLPGAPGAQGMTLDFSSTAWSAIFATVLVMAVLQALIHLADVIHPTWSRLRGMAGVASAVIGLRIVWSLAQSGQLFTVHGPANVAERVAALNQAFAIVSHVMVYGLAIGFVVALLVENWRLGRSFSGRAAPVLA